jgi:hypothetical protein
VEAINTAEKEETTEENVEAGRIVTTGAGRMTVVCTTVIVSGVCSLVTAFDEAGEG